MPCYSPIRAWRSARPNANGKFPPTWSANDAMPGPDSVLSLPCGSCVGCLLERSRQWAMRGFHESMLYNSNIFLTLTYSDKYLPDDLSLDVSHFQKFMKRLRKHFTGQTIRFLHCGEYGEKYGRPHYHAILFNCDFADKECVRGGEYPLFQSETLSRIWGLGFAAFGGVTFDSIAYVARYVMKKAGAEAQPDDGRRPEYMTMSRRPGIGAAWWSKYRKEVFANDGVVIEGRLMRPPKYYDRLLEQTDAAAAEALKRRRLLEDEDMYRLFNETSGRRSMARHKFARLRQETFAKRNLEGES